jgi:hypothetical protein
MLTSVFHIPLRKTNWKAERKSLPNSEKLPMMQGWVRLGPIQAANSSTLHPIDARGDETPTVPRPDRR